MCFVFAQSDSKHKILLLIIYRYMYIYIHTYIHTEWLEEQLFFNLLKVTGYVMHQQF
jgi:hypothetical protein